MTKAEQVIEILKGRGAREVTSTSRKYRKFTYPNRPDQFYWIGKAGAVRVGKTVGDSVSLTFAFHNNRR